MRQQLDALVFFSWQALRVFSSNLQALSLSWNTLF
jgi:hypothetical protein